jgi:hypothetical protein
VPFHAELVEVGGLGGVQWLERKIVQDQQLDPGEAAHFVVLFSSASTVLRVPLFLLALLVVRGLPAALYRSALASIRDVAAAGLLQATSLPFIVAATTIGLQLHAIRPANAAALVAAGLFSVIIFPTISLQLLRSSAKGPSTAPEQAPVR